MKKIIQVVIVIALVLTTGCSLVKNSTKTQQDTNSANSTSSQNNNSNQNTTTEDDNKNSNQNNAADDVNNKPQENSTSNPISDDSKKTSTDVLIYLIAIDDGGKSGKKLATGDSIIKVKRTLTDSKAPLKDTLNLLFSLKDRFYGESGLYNALYQCNLKVENSKIEKGIATIKISGKLMLGGVMDIPRIKAQITETAQQFSTIKEVKVFINDKTIDEALSLK